MLSNCRSSETVFELGYLDRSITIEQRNETRESPTCKGPSYVDRKHTVNRPSCSDEEESNLDRFEGSCIVVERVCSVVDRSLSSKARAFVLRKSSEKEIREGTRRKNNRTYMTNHSDQIEEREKIVIVMVTMG